jgi:septum formation protein
MISFPPLILASGSPRRRELFTLAGFDVTFENPNVTEDYPSTLLLEEVPAFLAVNKSKAVKSHNLVISADTIVVINNRILNKPTTAQEAREMLQTLNNTTHTVYTGVCIRKEDKMQCFTEKTLVTMAHNTDVFIAAYIQTGSPYDKAGGYGIQDQMGFFGVTKIEGCFYNVMGFPMARFYAELTQFLLK